MSEKYPTCPECGSAELNVVERVSGDRTWGYSLGKERCLDSENIDDAEMQDCICRDCQAEFEADDIAWKEPPA